MAARLRALGSSLVLACMLSACAMVPPEPVVTGPTAAAPRSPIVDADAAGSIFAASEGGTPLFEDRRPRRRGDIVTVLIKENTSAEKSVSTDSTRKGSAGLTLGKRGPLPGAFGAQNDIDMSGSNSANGTGNSSAANTFTGTITSTVIDVLPNGNLRIAGEKEIAINRGNEYVKFSGTVDPRSIDGATNTVASTQVADVRLEFRSKGVMDEVQNMGWLQRFFLNVLPF